MQLVRTNKFASSVVLAAVLCASGCQSMSDSEVAWQTLHAVDFAQTYNATRDPCYRETDPLTSALIGEQPSPGQVIAWGVGTAVLHAYVSGELERRAAPKWVQRTWNVVTIGQTGITIAHNHNEGVRPFGSNDTVPGCSV